MSNDHAGNLRSVVERCAGDLGQGDCEQLLAAANELDDIKQKYAYLVERCAKTKGDQLLEIARLKAELARFAGVREKVLGDAAKLADHLEAHHYNMSAIYAAWIGNADLIIYALKGAKP